MASRTRRMLASEEGLELYHNSGGQYTRVLSDASQVARTRKLGIYSELCTPIVPPTSGCVRSVRPK